MHRTATAGMASPWPFSPPGHKRSAKVLRKMVWGGNNGLISGALRNILVAETSKEGKARRRIHEFQHFFAVELSKIEVEGEFTVFSGDDDKLSGHCGIPFQKL